LEEEEEEEEVGCLSLASSLYALSSEVQRMT
jgi:hypothetical protein